MFNAPEILGIIQHRIPVTKKFYFIYLLGDYEIKKGPETLIRTDQIKINNNYEINGLKNSMFFNNPVFPE